MRFKNLINTMCHCLNYVSLTRMKLCSSPYCRHSMSIIFKAFTEQFLSTIKYLNVVFYFLQIRLHILAMHELCEYTKGEGFSEGFDAHLNIEQMNKTSVELFQMYDDHRKKGIDVPTEKEFRGYYALLKLDKHPGYKVYFYYNVVLLCLILYQENSINTFF